MLIAQLKSVAPPPPSPPLPFLSLSLSHTHALFSLFLSHSPSLSLSVFISPSPSPLSLAPQRASPSPPCSVPSTFAYLGIGNESKATTAGLHSPAFKLDEDVLATGAALHASVALRALADLGGLAGKRGAAEL